MKSRSLWIAGRGFFLKKKAYKDYTLLFIDRECFLFFVFFKNPKLFV